jgi:hypothetical protein
MTSRTLARPVAVGPRPQPPRPRNDSLGEEHINKLQHLASLSILALSAVFGSSACTVVSSDEQDLSADDVAEGDEDIGEAQDALVYSCTNVSNANWPDAWETLETQVLAEVNKLRASGTTCSSGAKPKVPALTLNLMSPRPTPS